MTEDPKSNILKEENLLRRVTVDPNYLHEDGRPTSLAFRPRPSDQGKLSVDRQKLTTFERAVVSKEKYRLFAINAGFAFQCGFTCLPNPIPGNDAHALIEGDFKKKGKQLSQSSIEIKNQWE